MTIEKIYRVKNGEIVEVEVKRETKKMLFIERVGAFGYAAQIEKDFACLTEEEAVLENLNKHKERVGMFSDRLEREKERLENAERLAKTYSL